MRLRLCFLDTQLFKILAEDEKRRLAVEAILLVGKILRRGGLVEAGQRFVFNLALFVSSRIQGTSTSCWWLPENKAQDASPLRQLKQAAHGLGWKREDTSHVSCLTSQSRHNRLSRKKEPPKECHDFLTPCLNFEKVSCFLDTFLKLVL